MYGLKTEKLTSTYVIIITNNDIYNKGLFTHFLHHYLSFLYRLNTKYHQ